MKRPIVFSLFRDQSVFMTAVMGLMTFLAVVALGIAMAIGGGVVRWNRQWNNFATIQAAGDDAARAVQKKLDENKDKIESVRVVSNDEMVDMMRPWISGAGRGALEKYLPKMFEVEFKDQEAITAVRETIRDGARFITHSDALRPSVNAGWKMIAILGFLAALMIGAIGMCVSFVARNTALLHRRELEILNQVGASDSFVVRQMQMVITKICVVACGGGFLAALPVLGAVIGVAHSARVGLMAMLGIGAVGWGVLIMMPILIVIFAIVITKKTTLKILNCEQ